MRLDIRYRMSFRYPEPISEAHNEIRVRPRDLPTQRLLDHRLTTDPICRVLAFTDYHGTTVEHFGYLGAHREFEIVAEAAVETRPTEPIGDAPASELSGQDFFQDHIEWLSPSTHVQWDDELTRRSLAVMAGASTVHEVVERMVGECREILTYTKNSTHIGISLAELIDGRAGVCQDFAHLLIGMLRAVGIPARYVSGYLFAADETAIGASDVPVRVQTHAWVDAAIPGAGWLPVDPTNAQPVGERHVVIGHGRDYDDVAPVRGVYVGSAVPVVDSVVEIRRMEQIDRVMSDRPRRRGPLVPPPLPEVQDAQTAQQQQQQQ